MELSDPLLTAKECASALRVSLATFHRRVADGTIPQPLKFGALSKWQRSDILAVIDRAKAAREAA